MPQLEILKQLFKFLLLTLLLLRDRNKYVSHEAQKFLAPSSKETDDSRTRINIASPFPIINTSIKLIKLE